ncbi:Hypothetical predicted protein [Mytilus galloprovincialis]|uniref:B box-type domain-containing protein n=1 Tax=Mytilus galloprovincialis TaxID=29158 RepID=A0A8B6E3T2_MYTGA|nr:Hypothetical predicted protein [Mytilus galloprovincialis]
MPAAQTPISTGAQTPVKKTNETTGSQSPTISAAQLHVTKCIFCDSPAVFHCNECVSAFCHQCRVNHDKLPTTHNHTVIDLTKVDPFSLKATTLCLYHKSEFLYYCTQCYHLICGQCVTTDHKGHELTDIKTIANERREKAVKNISELKEEIEKISIRIKQMKEVEQHKIQKSAQSALTDIDETAKKMVKAISLKKEIKLNEIENSMEIEKEDFQYDLANKECVYKQHTASYESLQRLMDVSHDITFITSYETLKRDMLDSCESVEKRQQEPLYGFDKKMFVQEAVNAIVTGFEMCLVGKEDGSVVLMHKTDMR